MSSEPFKEMAAEIEHNNTSNFAGGFVIVPPDGEPLRMLFLNPSPDPAVFWGTLQTTIEIALAELKSRQGGFGQR